MAFYYCHVPGSSFDVLVIDYGDRAFYVRYNDYTYFVHEGYPPFRYIDGATVRCISDKQGFKILNKCLKEKSGRNSELEKLINNLEELPF